MLAARHDIGMVDSSHMRIHFSKTMNPINQNNKIYPSLAIYSFSLFKRFLLITFLIDKKIFIFNKNDYSYIQPNCCVGLKKLDHEGDKIFYRMYGSIYPALNANDDWVY